MHKLPGIQDCSAPAVVNKRKKGGNYLVCAELHNDVDILLVLEDVFELHHVLVPERLVDLDLCLELLSRPTFKSRSHQHSHTALCERAAECEETL